jgi:hypothetical protein
MARSHISRHSTADQPRESEQHGKGQASDSKAQNDANRQRPDQVWMQFFAVVAVPVRNFLNFA